MKKYIYINIYLNKIGFTPAGVISFDTTNNMCGFSYFDEYIEQKHPPINPATLNWKKTGSPHFLFKNLEQFDRTFWELIPTDIDWSYKLILSRFPEYEYMTLPEKLFFLKSRTVGGLQAHMEKEEDEHSIRGSDWLEKIYSESIDFYNNYTQKIRYHQAFTPMTTYGGLRPKCMYEDENNELWIAKFNTPDDDYNMAHVEQVCMDMAKDLGLPVTESNILSLKSQKTDIFLSKRFDRFKDKRVHSIPFFALAENMTKPKHDKAFSGNSPIIMKNILEYSDYQNTDTLLLVQKFIFDMAVNNTDNHLRNIRLLLNDNYLWEVAPLFDITMTPYICDFVYNPAALPTSELYLDNPGLPKHLSSIFSLNEDKIKEMIRNCRNVTDNYIKYCENVKMNENDIILVEKCVNIGTYNQDVNIKSKKSSSFNNYPKLIRKF